MKYLCEYEKDLIRFSKLRRKGWQMVSRAMKLYRVDDEISVKSAESSDSFVIYPFDGIQPRTCTGKSVSVTQTRALILSCKTSKTKRKIWANINGRTIETAFSVIAIGGTAVWFILNQLGI